MGAQPSRSAADAGSDEKFPRETAHTRRFAQMSLSDKLPLAELKPSSIAQWQDDFLHDAKSRLASTVLSKTNFNEALVKSQAANHDAMVFNVQVSTIPTPVTNQKSSGRCWLFATCNVVRTGIVKKLNLGDFELSQSYLFFWDCLEKANYFLELSIELADQPLDSRLMAHLASAPESDGGQWDMVVNLIEKYGLVPKSVYPESYHSSNSSGLDNFLTTKLRDYAVELRSIVNDSQFDMGKEDPSIAQKMAIAKARSAKQTMMSEVYKILAIAIGPPPAPDVSFKWEYADKNGKAHTITSSPLDFYHNHCAGFKASEYISLINDPRNAYDALYTVDKLGNVWGGRPVLYVNTTSAILKETIVKMLKADQPCWFGCDVGKMSNSQLGIMDSELYAYNDAFGVKPDMTKAERLQMQDSAMTHAMVISAAHVNKDDELVRCKVENSWSDTAGDHGYFVMTDKWIDEYLFQIVVPRNMAPPHLRKIFETGKATVLPAWDPMGSLA